MQNKQSFASKYKNSSFQSGNLAINTWRDIQIDAKLLTKLDTVFVNFMDKSCQEDLLSKSVMVKSIISYAIVSFILWWQILAFE